MLVGVKSKRWILLPQSVYLHKKFGRVTLTEVFAGKVSFKRANEDGETEERTFLEKAFRRGILEQVKRGGMTVKAGENFVERVVTKWLITKAGQRIRFLLRRRVFIPD